MNLENNKNNKNNEETDGSNNPGLKRKLKNRHIQMIALGGAIGAGLFYGAKESISLAGPSILLAYVLGGIMIFIIVRALGEMSVHTPVSGAFSYYAHKNWGRFAGFFSGWNYWFNYVAVSMAELAVVGIYVNFWFPDIPSWVSSGVFLLLVTAINLTNVKAFGEFEFWFAIVKVLAIIALIIFGGVIILFGVGGTPTGISNLWQEQGFFPGGWLGFLTSLVLVMFSFGGVELIGIAAGEADNPSKTIPKAINQVVFRILLFYIGALFVILAIIPWTQVVAADSSPFVTVYNQIGIGSAANIMNLVVLTAAVSAYNSGLYSNGRMLYSLSLQGDAPKFLSKVSKQGSPYAGVLTSSAVTAIAVIMDYFLHDKIFLYLIAIALIAGILNWTTILITQILFRKRIGAKEVSKLSFPVKLFPYSSYLALAFMAMLVVLMAIIGAPYRIGVIVGPIWVALLAGFYFIFKHKKIS